MSKSSPKQKINCLHAWLRTLAPQKVKLKNVELVAKGYKG